MYPPIPQPNRLPSSRSDADESTEINGSRRMRMPDARSSVTSSSSDHNSQEIDAGDDGGDETHQLELAARRRVWRVHGRPLGLSERKGRPAGSVSAKRFIRQEERGENWEKRERGGKNLKTEDTEKKSRKREKGGGEKELLEKADDVDTWQQRDGAGRADHIPGTTLHWVTSLHVTEDQQFLHASIEMCWLLQDGKSFAFAGLHSPQSLRLLKTNQKKRKKTKQKWK